jgi:hypothetical protein
MVWIAGEMLTDVARGSSPRIVDRNACVAQLPGSLELGDVQRLGVREQRVNMMPLPIGARFHCVEPREGTLRRARQAPHEASNKLAAQPIDRYGLAGGQRGEVTPIRLL